MIKLNYVYIFSEFNLCVIILIKKILWPACGHACTGQCMMHACVKSAHKGNACGCIKNKRKYMRTHMHADRATGASRRRPRGGGGYRLNTLKKGG